MSVPESSLADNYVHKEDIPFETEEAHDRRIIARFNAINEAIVNEEAEWAE